MKTIDYVMRTLFVNLKVDKYLRVDREIEILKRLEKTIKRRNIKLFTTIFRIIIIFTIIIYKLFGRNLLKWVESVRIMENTPNIKRRIDGMTCKDFNRNLP